MSMDFLPLILIFLLAIYNDGKHLTSDINKDKCPSIRTPVLVCVLFEFQFFYFLICAASSCISFAFCLTVSVILAPPRILASSSVDSSALSSLIDVFV